MQLLYNIAAIIVVVLIIPMFMIRAVRERGFVERIKQLVDERCSSIWRSAALQTDEDRFELYNAFIIHGCIGMIRRWLDGDGSGTPEDMSRMAAAVILSSVRSVLL